MAGEVGWHPICTLRRPSHRRKEGLVSSVANHATHKRQNEPHLAQKGTEAALNC